MQKNVLKLRDNSKIVIAKHEIDILQVRNLTDEMLEWLIGWTAKSEREVVIQWALPARVRISLSSCHFFWMRIDYFLRHFPMTEQMDVRNPKYKINTENGLIRYLFSFISTGFWYNKNERYLITSYST